LSLLLANGRRQRCIDRVEAELEQILAARAQRQTWDAIADALDMKRCTLINAVKRLQQSAMPQIALPRVIQAPRAVVKPIVQPTPTPTPQPLPLSSTEPMVIAVGRAQVEDYQL
jgi:hypothetical protein